MLVWFAAAVLTSPPPEERDSLEIEPPKVVWESPGFRLGLSYGLEAAIGRHQHPTALTQAVHLHLGARVDPDWSLLLGLTYGILEGSSSGLVFRGTLEPTLHLPGGLQLGLGAGLGGIVMNQTGQPTPAIGPQVASTTVPSDGPLLGECSGVGVVATARLGHAWAISDLLALGASFHGTVQWTRCTESFGDSDPDTQEPIDLHQVWSHFISGLELTLWWR